MVTPTQLKRFRKKNDMPREALAILVGVSSQTIWRWEAGGAIPEPEQKVLRTVMDGGDGLAN